MHYCALVFSVVTFFWLKGRSRIPNTLLYFESLCALLCFLSHGFLEIGCQGQEDNTRISYYFEILVLNHCAIWSFFTEKGNDFQKQIRCKKKLGFCLPRFDQWCQMQWVVSLVKQAEMDIKCSLGPLQIHKTFVVLLSIVRRVPSGIGRSLLIRDR